MEHEESLRVLEVVVPHQLLDACQKLKVDQKTTVQGWSHDTDDNESDVSISLTKNDEHFHMLFQGSDRYLTQVVNSHWKCEVDYVAPPGRKPRNKWKEVPQVDVESDCSPIVVTPQKYSLRKRKHGSPDESDDKGKKVKVEGKQSPTSEKKSKELASRTAEKPNTVHIIAPPEEEPLVAEHSYSKGTSSPDSPNDEAGNRGNTDCINYRKINFEADKNRFRVRYTLLSGQKCSKYFTIRRNSNREVTLRRMKTFIASEGHRWLEAKQGYLLDFSPETIDGLESDVGSQTVAISEAVETVVSTVAEPVAAKKTNTDIEKKKPSPDSNVKRLMRVRISERIGGLPQTPNRELKMAGMPVVKQERSKSPMATSVAALESTSKENGSLLGSNDNMDEAAESEETSVVRGELEESVAVPHPGPEVIREELDNAGIMYHKINFEAWKNRYRIRFTLASGKKGNKYFTIGRKHTREGVLRKMKQYVDREAHRWVEAKWYDLVESPTATRQGSPEVKDNTSEHEVEDVVGYHTVNFEGHKNRYRVRFTLPDGKRGNKYFTIGKRGGKDMVLRRMKMFIDKESHGWRAGRQRRTKDSTSNVSFDTESDVSPQVVEVTDSDLGIGPEMSDMDEKKKIRVQTKAEKWRRTLDRLDVDRPESELNFDSLENVDFISQTKYHFEQRTNRYRIRFILTNGKTTNRYFTVKLGHNKEDTLKTIQNFIDTDACNWLKGRMADKKKSYEKYVPDDAECGAPDDSDLSDDPSSPLSLDHIVSTEAAEGVKLGLNFDRLKDVDFLKQYSANFDKKRSRMRLRFMMANGKECSRSYNIRTGKDWRRSLRMMQKFIDTDAHDWLKARYVPTEMRNSSLSVVVPRIIMSDMKPEASQSSLAAWTTADGSPGMETSTETATPRYGESFIKLPYSEAVGMLSGMDESSTTLMTPKSEPYEGDVYIINVPVETTGETEHLPFGSMPDLMTSTVSFDMFDFTSVPPSHTVKYGERPTSLPCSEAIKILSCVDGSKVSSVPPREPHGGELYLISSGGYEAKVKDWKKDQIQWKIHNGTKLFPALTPLVKKVQHKMSKHGSFRRQAWWLLNNPHLVLLQYLGDHSEIVPVLPKIKKRAVNPYVQKMLNFA